MSLFGNNNFSNTSFGQVAANASGNTGGSLFASSSIQPQNTTAQPKQTTLTSLFNQQANNLASGAQQSGLFQPKTSLFA